MTKHSHVWFHRFSERNGGDLAPMSRELRDEILNMRAAGSTKRQIADSLGVHLNTVKMVTWKARQEADPRAYKGTTRMSKIMGSCDSVLELRNYQWFVRGLAERFDVHYTQVEAILDDVAEEVMAKVKTAEDVKAKASK